MPSRSKEKGDRGERALVKKLSEIKGVMAARIPLSGAAGGEFAGDLAIRIGTMPPTKGEVKCRHAAAGWKTIKKWLGANDYLFLKEDLNQALVVMPFHVFQSLVERGNKRDEHSPKESKADPDQLVLLPFPAGVERDSSKGPGPGLRHGDDGGGLAKGNPEAGPTDGP